MIYEYSCSCGKTWTKHRPVKDRNKPTVCECGGTGKRLISAVPWYFNKTHPDVKQDMHEMIAGEPPSNLMEI